MTQPFTRVLHSQMSGYPEPVELAVTSDSAWRAVWGAMSPNRAAGPPPLPTVDFAREMVLVVAAGQRPTGGYDVHVDTVEQDARGGLLVRYTLVSPGAGCMTAQMITSPVDVVRTAAATGPVRFAARRATQPC